MREDGIQKGFLEEEAEAGFSSSRKVVVGSVRGVGTCQVRGGFQTSGAEGGGWRVI